MPKNRRAEAAADFAGPDANQEAIETFSKKSKKENAKGNNGPVSDETVAMHVNLIRAAEAQWREKRDEASALQGVLRNSYKTAKHDGVDVESLRLALRLDERVSGEVIAEQRAIARYLKIMQSPIGYQFSIWEAPEDGAPDGPKVDANLQGQHAGRNGEPSENNPFNPGTEDFTEWAAGWVNGQEILARGEPVTLA